MNFSQIDIDPGIRIRIQQNKIDTAWVKVEGKEEFPCLDCPKIKFDFVPPRGSKDPLHYLVGEAPGEEEAEAHQPFVGPAGKLLRHALLEAEIDLEQTRWFNTVACRPTTEDGKNRAPKHDEAVNCMAYLKADIRKYQPIALILMGRVAMEAFLAGTEWEGIKISKMRGAVYSMPGYAAAVRVTWHPAYVLRRGGAGTQAYQQLVLDLNMKDYFPVWI